MLKRFFMYDGWKLLMELDPTQNNEPVTEYTWGLDLSGLNGNPTASGTSGAGGIGGLLASSGALRIGPVLHGGDM